MKITANHIILPDSKTISWAEVQRVRAAGNKLGIVLNSGKTVEVPNLSSTTVDHAFKTFEEYLRQQKTVR